MWEMGFRALECIPSFRIVFAAAAAASCLAGGACSSSEENAASRPGSADTNDGGVTEGGASGDGSAGGDAEAAVSEAGSTVAEEDPCAAWEGVFPSAAFPVTPADKGNLQALLDAHGTLRLAAGDYRTGGPTSIRLNAEQAIVALLPATFPDVVVAAGATHATLRGVRGAALNFEAGASTRYNCFSQLGSMAIAVKGATVERNLFLGIADSALEVDTSTGGVFRDNRFIKLNSHGNPLPIQIKGDPMRQSGGNAFLLVDSQTPPGSAFTVDGQRDIAFVGVNAEAMNFNHDTTTPYLFKVTNTGTFRGAHFVGISKVGSDVSPALDFEADNVLLHDANVGTESPKVRLRAGTRNLFSWQNGWGPSDLDDQVQGGLRVFAQNGGDDVSVTLGASEMIAPPAAPIATALHDLLANQGGSGAAWSLPNFGAIPDPVGANWNSGRDAQPDDADAIDQRIATEGVAQLDARIYYTSRPIVLHAGQGLVGAGAGKTAIVAKTDAIDIVHVEFGDPNGCAATAGGFTLADLTLQGGANGVHSDYPGTQINKAIVSHVTFRNMVGAGIFVDHTYGWDNNFFDYLNFVDSGYGVRQEGHEKPASSCYGIGEWSTMGYVDKTVFYRNRFVRCKQAFVSHPTRPNNLDAIVDSSFQSGAQAAVEIGQATSGMLIATSSFIDNGGSPVVSGPTAIVDCSFTADRGTAMIGPFSDIEGCSFARGTSSTATVFGNVTPTDWRDPHFVNMANSVSTDMPLGALDTTLPIAGLFVNNQVLSGEPLQAFLTALEYRTLGTVDSADDTRSIYGLLTGPATPGSQLLLGAPWK